VIAPVAINADRLRAKVKANLKAKVNQQASVVHDAPPTRLPDPRDLPFTA
jgi:hypothetical protein